ncbi:AAA family ATPase [Hymenobacter cavernae]|uniref:ATPase AAA-type core domain-containing protein n=1 Tax=Hymenobacter cavernae TaxID=2044852 RepID=A0ABQ1UX97_9BACT|nr:AAA family ATPase [Hymenobacter cavernae]GGF27429.1 hypothetical protein GCM10011383_43880 [Hymenobacter cavernae]
MRLVAIYIAEHEYLFSIPQSINFGGKYLYSFEKSQSPDSILVTREVNPNFIEGFFNITGSKSKVTNLSAIVGQNGAGKSSLLDVIRSIFIRNGYALPQSQCLVLAESATGNKLFVLRNDFARISLRNKTNDEEGTITYKSQRITSSPSKSAQTLYYSPHFDYKYNPNFDNVDGYDISFDRILEEDLNELGEMDASDGGGAYSINEELAFKNSLRQIEFLSSDLVAKHQIFKDIYPLKQHGNPILKIRGYKQQEREWNTPEGFREILKLIHHKNEEELRAWAKVRDDEDLSQVEVYRYIFKREVIKAVLSVFYQQMEKENHYLWEGRFPLSDLRESLENSTSHEALNIFIENAEMGKGENAKKILLDSGLRELVEKIFSSIDIVEGESNIESREYKTSKQDAIEILSLQRNFIKVFNKYYRVFAKDNDGYMLSDDYKIRGFVNYMPFDQKLSSGEHALLNLFSRIYNFLTENLIDNQFRKLHEHYIILLDEADLSFHPIWKRRYVKALLQTLPYFFEQLDKHPSIQIIFTTHDPLSLSDLPNCNVVYLRRPSYEEAAVVSDYSDMSRPSRTFGANIAELLADSFFLDGALVGDFAQDIIQETIKWLDSPNREKAERYSKIIKMVDEPIVQTKLAEMFDEKMTSNLQAAVIDDQIRKLQELRKKLRS